MTFWNYKKTNIQGLSVKIDRQINISQIDRKKNKEREETLFLSTSDIVETLNKTFVMTKKNRHSETQYKVSHFAKATLASQ